MKTLCQVEEKKSINWNTIIANKLAGKRVRFSQDVLNELAGSWVTCACGNQCDVIDRNSWGEPYDDQLRDLGYNFTSNVEDENWKEAKRNLAAIERRSTVLIREYNKNVQEEIKRLKLEKDEIEKEITSKTKELVK